MIYGYKDLPSGQWRKWTRISSSAVMMNRPGFIDGRSCLGLALFHPGCHRRADDRAGLSDRRLGGHLHPWQPEVDPPAGRAVYPYPQSSERAGYTRGAVQIGAYSFLAAGAKVLPGVTIGKGCLVGAGALVTKDLPDYAVAVGAPAKVVGSTIDMDLEFFRQQDFSATYYDPDALALIQSKLSNL